MKNSCKGTGYIPSNYLPCPRCRGQGKGLLQDCRLCDDLCYVTESWIPCQICQGKGKQGGLLSGDCSACNGVGYNKPGMGINLAQDAYGMNRGRGGYNMPGTIPPSGGYGPSGYGPSGYGPSGYGPSGYGPHGYGPHHGYGPRY